jgi:outer membrane protein TolC
LQGCKSATEHREKADDVAHKIIETKQQEALGRTERFTVERPSDVLRRRLLIEQNLPYSSPASLGPDALETVKYWPEPNYPYGAPVADANFPVEPNQPLKLTMIDSLQVAAYNSNEYQNEKERVFQTALALDLQRNDFRNIFSANANSSFTSDLSSGTTTNSVRNTGTVGVDRLFASGLGVSSALILDLTNLLRPNSVSGYGLVSDTSLTLPLLRGAGRHIVTEPLTQAERNVIYDLWGFERYKRTFSVNVGSQYLNVLQQVDQVKNAADNYRRAVTSARRSRRHADAGRLSQVELDQALQNELDARNRWISDQERLKGSLDSFKRTLGLPTDARVELDRSDLDQLVAPALKQVEQVVQEGGNDAAGETPPADAPVVLVPATREGAGPYELDESTAIDLALENRLDLRVANGEVYDAQRRVVVAADNLRAGLDLRAGFTSGRADKNIVRFDNGTYDASLAMDLPLERTAERNAYRQSLINLDRATRDLQRVEDDIKVAVRNDLRALLENRETLKIQVRAVAVAKRRVRMTDLLLEAGRAQMRDVLDAQAALLSAQNALTGAVVQYRTAELEMQRDMDVLQVNEKGLWQELSPEEIRNDI